MNRFHNRLLIEQGKGAEKRFAHLADIGFNIRRGRLDAAGMLIKARAGKADVRCQKHFRCIGVSGLKPGMTKRLYRFTCFALPLA